MAVDDLDVALDERTCVELLDLESHGRVAFPADDGPRIVPVTYVRRGARLDVRAPASSGLAGLGAGTRVALEIDQIDRDLLRGWTVLAVGPCVVRDAASTPATGTRAAVHVTMTCESLTGRWIGPVRRALQVRVDGQVDGRGAVRVPVS